MSSVGKGITTASIGKVLQARGYAVTALKIDPYVNVDAGSMSSLEHGEIFVTENGDETDLDMGNYERFLDQNMMAGNHITTGSVYKAVIEKERNGDYQGKCVEVVPHIPEEVIRQIQETSEKQKADIAVIEIGGTLGEYQNILFLEAARMLHLENPEDVLFVLVSYLPIPKHLGEMKTKPTQHATRALHSVGIRPDFIICRGERYLEDSRKKKLSVLCNVKAEDIISVPDMRILYEVPLCFEEQSFSQYLLRKLYLSPRSSDLHMWKKHISIMKNTEHSIRIGIIGKNFSSGDFTLSDAYLSVVEALRHAACAMGKSLAFDWVNAELFEKEAERLSQLKQYDGILIPGGLGMRSIEGLLSTISFVRENKIPYFGICYGMQLACIEFARNVLHTESAHTVEIDEQTQNPIIHLRKHQNHSEMRLGSYDCHIQKDSKAFLSYKKEVVRERHRHRYEFNTLYRNLIEEKGLMVSGFNTQLNLVEIVELKDHPWFVGVQFHPEFLSRPLKPHPLFLGFMQMANKKQEASVY